MQIHNGTATFILPHKNLLIFLFLFRKALGIEDFHVDEFDLIDLGNPRVDAILGEEPLFVGDPQRRDARIERAVSEDNLGRGISRKGMDEHSENQSDEDDRFQHVEIITPPKSDP
jgi:hypothetical protein